PPRRVVVVAARRSTALRLTRTSAIQSRSRGMPGLWGSFRAAAPGVGPSAGDAVGAWPGPPSAVLAVFADFAALAVFAAAAPDGPAVWPGSCAAVCFAMSDFAMLATSRPGRPSVAGRPTKTVSSDGGTLLPARNHIRTTGSRRRAANTTDSEGDSTWKLQRPRSASI